MNNDNYWIKNERRIRKQADIYLKQYERTAAAYSGLSLPKNFTMRVHAVLPPYIRFLTYHLGGRHNMFNRLMPAVAIMAAVHWILRTAGWTVDQIAKLNYEMFYSYFRRMPALIRRLMRNFMVSPAFVKTMKKPCTAMKESGRDDTFDLSYSFDKGSKKTIMSCEKCGMISYLKRAEMTEMLSYCNVFDYAQADAIGLGLVQPLCIGAGDSCCIYRFSRNPADTRYPDGLNRILATAMEI